MNATIVSSLAILSPETCESIVGIGEFTPPRGPKRFYLNLRHVNRTFRGDCSTKLWIDDRGVLIHEVGKGTTSYPFRDDRDAVLKLAEANGITVEKRS